MLVYSIIFILLIFGIFHYDVRKNIFLDKFYYFLVFVVMTAMTALRYRVGGDSLGYEDYYDYLPNLHDLGSSLTNGKVFNYQPLYLLFVALCKSIKDDYYVYQIVHAIVVNITLFWFINKHSKYKFTVLFVLYFFLFYFYFGFEVQREILANCCFLIAYPYFVKNKWIWYYLLATVAFFFHISAVILFILPLFKLIKFNRKFIFIILIVTFPLAFARPYLYSFFEIFFINDAMQSKGKVYSEIEFSIVGMLFFYFVRVIINLPFILFSTKNKSGYGWLLSAFLILSIASQIMVGFDRFMNYLYIPYILLMVEFLYTNFGQFALSNFKRKYILLTMFFSLFFVLGYKVAMDVGVKGRARYQAVFFPYGSTFEKHKHLERENFMRELWSRK